MLIHYLAALVIIGFVNLVILAIYGKPGGFTDQVGILLTGITLFLGVILAVTVLLNA